ncbi:squalene synthase HpnC [Thermomonospora echinospora]|uniref:Squalene synthase HpnC n=1 Tax=Thermomonospora echinospora TaxID=1992 RepID=A0A1H5ZWP3_9ACTN|nr:squalene synthase HpnC [Thermomonospora echinospora]SEG40869.1 squalene synthase HpnC [Thermomonospora echinospora]
MAVREPTWSVREHRRTLDELVRRENFPVATRLLPPRYRARLLAVYGFARLVDDIGDEAPPDERGTLLDLVERDLDVLYAGGRPQLPQLRELAGTVAACRIPAEPFHRLIRANRQDQVVHRYDTFERLREYCVLSANPVGHIVLHVFGAATAHRMAFADRICTALQLVEHCQDVGEDYRRGRVYLPAEDLRRFGCTEADLGRPVTPTRLRGLLAFQVDRARRLLNEGAPLIGTLSGWARIAVAGYVAGGRATLAAFERGGYDVLGGRLRAGRARLPAEWSRALGRSRP